MLRQFWWHVRVVRGLGRLHLVPGWLRLQNRDVVPSDAQGRAGQGVGRQTWTSANLAFSDDCLCGHVQVGWVCTFVTGGGPLFGPGMPSEGQSAAAAAQGGVEGRGTVEMCRRTWASAIHITCALGALNDLLHGCK